MKKGFSLLLTLCMILSLIPSAFAAGEGNPFADVKESDWFYGDVLGAYQTGLINGKTATEYKPDDFMTYAEAIKLAACMNQYVTEGKVTLRNGEPWYSTYVNYAKANGIVAKEYDYNENATRAGYMEIFASCLPEESLKAINSVPDDAIPDVKSADSYAPAVYKLYRAGILTGVDDAHRCNPSANIKRSEVAAILTRMMDEGVRKEFSMGDEATDAPDAATTPEVTAKPEATEAPDATANPNATTAPEATLVPAVTAKPEATLAPAATEKPVRATAAPTGKPVRATAAPTEKPVHPTKEPVDPLVIVDKPQNATVAKGEDATFHVTVSGGKAPYTFQWKYANLGTRYVFYRCEDAAEWYERYSITNDDTGSTLIVTDVDEYAHQDGSMYYCVITDAYGNQVVSETALLQIKPLTITKQPSDAEVKDPGTPRFTVEVSVEAAYGSAPYTYQWYSHSTPIQESWRGHEGCTTNTLIMVNPTPGHYEFSCVITDSKGNQVTSDKAHIHITK